MPWNPPRRGSPGPIAGVRGEGVDAVAQAARDQSLMSGLAIMQLAFGVTRWWVVKLRPSSASWRKVGRVAASRVSPRAKSSLCQKVCTALACFLYF